VRVLNTGTSSLTSRKGAGGPDVGITCPSQKSSAR
jgi:hypothetical protein